MLLLLLQLLLLLLPDSCDNIQSCFSLMERSLLVPTGFINGETTSKSTSIAPALYLDKELQVDIVTFGCCPPDLLVASSSL